MYTLSISILLFHEYSMYAAYTTYNGEEDVRHDTPSAIGIYVTIL